MLEIAGGADPTEVACATGSSGNWYPARGEKWITGNYGNTIYNHYYPPREDRWDCMNIQQQKAFTTARSNHRNVVNTLLCDGSVRAVQQDLGIAIWRSLASRAGGEVVHLE